VLEGSFIGVVLLPLAVIVGFGCISAPLEDEPVD
jgi:hypothetical protein